VFQPLLLCLDLYLNQAMNCRFMMPAFSCENFLDFMNDKFCFPGRLDMNMTRRHLKRFSGASIHALVHLRHILSFQIPNHFLDGFAERVSKLALLAMLSIDIEM
jgi:hypothetical protein